MPNWCSNTLFIEGPSKWINTLKKKARGETEVFDFYRLIRCPREIARKDYDPYRIDWEYNTFGCKWGGCNSIKFYESRLGRKEKTIAYEFDTPWSPAQVFVKNISKKYPSLTFSLFYYEDGSGFIGSDLIRSGVYLKEQDADLPFNNSEDDEDGDKEIECIRSWFENASQTATSRAYWK